MRTTLLPLALFGVAITAAALAYPGGTWLSRSSEGFSFWHNFWCDLLSARALNGHSNRASSYLARFAFFCFAIALYRFWPQAARLARSSRSSRATGVGRLGAAALLVVALVPASTSQLAHGVAVVGSAGAALIAAGLLLPGLRAHDRVAALLGALALGAALLCLAQYVGQGLGALSEADWLAGMQKIATALFLAFVLRLEVRRDTATQAPPRG